MLCPNLPLSQAPNAQAFAPATSMTLAEIQAEINILAAERPASGLQPQRKTGHGNNPWIAEDAKRPQYVSEREAELRWELAFRKKD